MEWEGGAAHLLSSTRTNHKIGACAGDIVPAIKARQRDLPVDEVGVVEDVALDVVVVELLRRQNNRDLGVVQLRKNLEEKVLVADHVGIKYHHKLHRK